MLGSRGQEGRLALQPQTQGVHFSAAALPWCSAWPLGGSRARALGLAVPTTLGHRGEGP